MYKERICGLDKSILNGAEKFSSSEILHILVRVLIPQSFDLFMCSEFDYRLFQSVHRSLNCK
jgi:hypothetical protein